MRHLHSFPKVAIGFFHFQYRFFKNLYHYILDNSKITLIYKTLLYEFINEQYLFLYCPDEGQYLCKLSSQKQIEKLTIYFSAMPFFNRLIDGHEDINSPIGPRAFAKTVVEEVIFNLSDFDNTTFSKNVHYEFLMYCVLPMSAAYGALYALLNFAKGYFLDGKVEGPLVLNEAVFAGEAVPEHLTELMGENNASWLLVPSIE